MTLSCPDCCGTGYLSPEEARIVALMAENAALSQQLAEARAELGETRLVLETQENQFGLLQADFNDCNTERARWQGRTAAAEALVAEIREALELALEYWAHKQQRYKNRHPAWVVAAKAALSERDAPQAQVVALPWYKPVGSNTLSRADTDLGIYRSWTHFEANGKWFWSLDGYEKLHGEPVDTEDEAKAAAQADFERRILSALLPSTTVVQKTQPNGNSTTEAKPVEGR